MGSRFLYTPQPAPTPALVSSRFVSVPRGTSCSHRLFLRRLRLIRCNLVQRSSAKFLAGDFAISLLQYLAEFRPLRLLPQPTSIRNQNCHRHGKLLAAEMFVWTPSSQQPVNRTHPTHPFNFGSPAGVASVKKVRVQLRSACAAVLRLIGGARLGSSANLSIITYCASRVKHFTTLRMRLGRRRMASPH